MTPEMTIEIPVNYSDNSISEPSAVSPTSDLATKNNNFELSTLESGGWLAPSLTTVIRLGWAAGVLLLLGSLLLNLWRLRRLRHNGLPWIEQRDFMKSLAAECGILRNVEVLLHEDLQTPLTCGVRRPTIMLPADVREWDQADLRRVLVHELEHVRRGDWIVQLAARAICAVYWFHPLIWVASRRLSLEAERACDDAVIQNAENTEYADQLVLLARRLSKPHGLTTIGMANRSDLSIRISSILDDRQRRGRAGLLAAAGAMLVASLLVLSIAPIRAVVAQSSVAQKSDVQTKDTKERPSSPLDQALYEAAENGDISEINRLLDAGANVNSMIDGDGSPLIGAARNGRFAAVRLLLDRGADPNLSVPGDGNPLIMASGEGQADVVTLLLDRGARIDAVVPGDENALIQASGSGQLAVVKLLVSRGADVDTRVWVDETPWQKGEWRSPLSMARKGGHKAVVTFLLASGAKE
jgi:beta-lactamase regulating signal transducer with metallopeptidase domain